MSENESIKRLTKLISAISNGRVEDVEAESESFATEWTGSEELKELHQEVVALVRKHLQAKEFILNLSMGNLDVAAPRGNRLIDPFKELQANLRHLVWQTQEIAQGNYNQRIDFLGDFSTSFNSLVMALNEKKLMEESLRESRFFFEESQRAASIGSYKTNFITGFWESSEILDQIFGIDKDYCRSISGWIQILHPEDQGMMYDYLINEVIAKHQPFDKEYRIIRQNDGETRWVHGQGKVAFDAEGKVISLIGTIQDITEKKLIEEALRLNEERYRNIFDNSVEGIFQTTLSGRLQIVNPAFARLFGYESPKEMIADVTDIKKQLYAKSEDRSRFVALLQKQGLLQNFEVRFKRKDETLFWVSINARIIRDDEGNPLYIEGTFVDITNRKLAEEQIRLDEARLESLLRINQHPADSIQELLDFALDEVISLTGSKIGYIYFYDEHKKEFTLNSWSKEVMKQCTVAGPQTIYELDKTGLWGEAVRQRRPILVNDFANPDPLKKGIPEGHSQLHKFLTIPVFSLGHIVAVVGVANKLDDYNDLDIRQLNLMMDSVWKIVQRTRTEDEITASEARLKRAELASCSGNWELHLDSQIIYASEGAMVVYGLNVNHLDYSLIKTIPLPEYRPLLNEAMKELLEDNIPYDIEFKIKAVKTGIIKDIHSLAVFDEERRIVFGIIQDISERKSIERSLQQSQTRLKTLVQTIPDLIWLKDGDGVYLSCNNMFERLYGTTENEIIGKTDYDFVEHKQADFFRENDQKAIQAGVPTSNEEWLTFADNGQRLMFDTLKTPMFDSDGVLIGVLGIARDITERKRNEEALKESENKFRTLFEQMSEGFALHEIIYDTNHVAVDYKILEINPSFEKQVGIQAENAKGALATQLYGVSPAPYIDIYAQVAETGEHKFFQTYFPPLDRHFQISAFSPNPGYFATIFVDITERRQYEEALKNNEVHLRELVATRDKFFSIISHDLKSPFNSIIGLSNLLVEQIQGKNVEGIEEYAGIIQKSSMQVFDLLVNLLEWSRSQTGRMEFSPEYVEMVALIKEVIELLGDSAQQKSITIHLELPRNMIAFIDKAMIGTILRNLISNAIKFTHPGGRIVISAEIKNEELIIAISDNGVGIKKERINKLFRIDENQTSLGTKNEKGTGLGLILCKEFIEKHGGKIWAESEVGKGSKFYFAIPKV